MTDESPAPIAAGGPRQRSKTLIWPAGLALLVLGLLLWPWPAPGWRGWAPLIWNWAHAPVLAIVTGAFLMALRKRGQSARAATAIALPTMLAYMAGVEYLQSWTGRSADWRDILTGGLGALSAASLFVAWTGDRISSSTRLLFTLTGLALLGATLQPLVHYGKAIAHYRSLHPTLEDFEGKFHPQLWLLEQNGAPVSLRLVEGSEGTKQGRQLRLEIPPKGLLSLHHDAQGRDWRGMRSLRFDYALTGSREVLLGIRLDGAHSRDQRLRLGVTLRPGHHRAQIELPDSVEAVAVLAQIQEIVLFTQDAGAEASLDLDQLRLESVP